MPLYSIKMRASKSDLHVSGAERIVPQADISSAVSALTERALHHGLGRADFINRLRGYRARGRVQVWSLWQRRRERHRAWGGCDAEG